MWLCGLHKYSTSCITHKTRRREQILTAIDVVVDVWQQQKSWSTSADPVSPAIAHLARALSYIGVRRENTIQGSYLECLAAQNGRSAGAWGLVGESLPSTV